MLEWIRRKFKGIIIWFIISIITIVFFLGSTSFLLTRNSHNKTIAKVNNQIISADTVNAIYAAQIKQYTAKKNYNTAELDPQKIKNHIISDLINQSAITTGLYNSGFIVNNKDVIHIIKNNPQFQENGRFSVEKYNNFFKHAPFTELEYQQFLKEYLLQEQLHNSILLSSFVSTQEVNNFITEWKQSRDFGFVIVPFKKFINQNINNKQINEQVIEDYYNNHKSLFVTPETVNIQYLEIAKEHFIKNTPVEKQELFKYYQEHIHYYTLPELINVKHILIPDNRSKIEEISSKLKAGEHFSHLARTYSQDQSSASKGGELGWIGKGETDPEFEKAAFSLKNIGDSSDIIKSSFGYHIIQLNERREAQIKTFEAILPELTQHYKEELAQSKLQNIIEDLENRSFENEELITLANKLDLKIQTAGPFTNNVEKEGVCSYTQVVMAAFNEKNLHKNSNLIKLNDDRFIILRVINKQASTNKTLIEAYNEIKEILQKNHAQQQAKQQGLNLAKQLLNTTNPNKLVKSLGLEWITINQATRDMQHKDINLEILKTAFSLTTTNNQKTFITNNGDFIIVKLLKIHNIQDLSTQPIAKIYQQLINLHAKLEQTLYEQELIKTAKIKFFNTEIGK